MNRQDLDKNALCGEAISNMSAIAQLDTALGYVQNTTTSLHALRATQNEAIEQAKQAFRNIPTADLSSDRVDLLSSLVTGDLGTTPIEIVVKDTLSNSITERRDHYRDRQQRIGKLMRGTGYYAITLFAEDIVRRSGYLVNSPPPAPIHEGTTLYIRTFRNTSIDVFTIWKASRHRERNSSGANFNGYSMLGVIPRGSGKGSRMCDISLVNPDGDPLVSMMPISGKPPRTLALEPRLI